MSSGRGVHEAIDAAERLSQEGIIVNIVDMPSIDENLIISLYNSGKPVLIAEQNNGYLWSHFKRVLFENEPSINTRQLISVNTTSKSGLHYIHSGTYTELAAHYELDGAHLYEKILKLLKTKKYKAGTL